jgi:cysteinyl-tRNA synthetase
MSKSKGNVVYTEDLLKKGYSPEHIRFYLIYGHYRKKMNLTDKKFIEAADILDRLRKMIKELKKHTKVDKSKKEVMMIISQLKLDFKKYMNDDMDVKGSIDGLYDSISHLLGHKKQGKLSDKDSDDITKELERIDEVLKVIFD